MSARKRGGIDGIFNQMDIFFPGLKRDGIKEHLNNLLTFALPLFYFSSLSAILVIKIKSQVQNQPQREGEIHVRGKIMKKKEYFESLFFFDRH
jgi:hypothetical protein